VSLHTGLAHSVPLACGDRRRASVFAAPGSLQCFEPPGQAQEKSRNVSMIAYGLPMKE
jgi:hypothetical protein